jgi:threonine/homoserine/homoserine lactone efflux protein
MVISGIILGLTIGLSPSPIMTLSISQTIKYNMTEGMKVFLAPLFTDLPIAAVSILIISKLPNQQLFLGIIFIIGSIFIARLGIKGIRSKTFEIDVKTEAPNSIKRGIITNLLNPNAYIFWFTIGSVAIVESWKLNPRASVLYLLGFYTFLIGSRATLSFAVAKTNVFRKPKVYLISMKFLGTVLIAFSMFYAYDGINKLFL